ncbi:tRNA-dependent cyclodipeptide synthase [Geobacillus thermodenitrificans]|uniref:tRNA-dependent cyclodipeptide synthase n=1 Tax=Geobacillus thermodenitrificans TaxID=33940 RepID=UPI002E214D11|nr:tRNA-dependent cyclodipeptide synthase [Geobacillus thermodenitrificans]
MQQVIKDLFYVVPLSRNCEKIYKNKTHILLGISPFNSKFSQNYIHQLIDWSSKNFKNVTVLLAGDEAKNLLEALGTPTTKAERKVRKEIRRHFRFSEEALRKNGREIDIYTFSDFKNNKIYNEVYQNVIYYFEKDEKFRKSCLAMSHDALSSRAKSLNMEDIEITDNMLFHSVKYVLAELPFFLSGASILGYKESVLAYHRPWKLGEKIKNSEFYIKMSDNQGYIILKQIN